MGPTFVVSSIRWFDFVEFWEDFLEGCNHCKYNRFQIVRIILVMTGLEHNNNTEPWKSSTSSKAITARLRCRSFTADQSLRLTQHSQTLALRGREFGVCNFSTQKNQRREAAERNM